jgi:hypothetical protein
MLARCDRVKWRHERYRNTKKPAVSGLFAFENEATDPTIGRRFQLRARSKRSAFRPHLLCRESLPQASPKLKRRSKARPSGAPRIGKATNSR